MNQERPGSERPPGEERLSGTLIGGVQNLASSLGGLSTAFASAGIASLVLGIILLIFVPGLRLYSYIILAVGAGLILIALVLSFQTVSRAVTGRRGRYSTNTTVMVVAFIGIAAVVNFLAFENPARMDVTATKQFSLAPRTVELLKNLQEPVEAKAFFPPGRSAEEAAILTVLGNRADDLMHEFEVRSGKFSYEFIDPDVDPLTAREYEVSRYPAIVLEGKESGKRHHISLSARLEGDFVTGLLIVTGQEQKRVYFLTGHGEGDIQNLEADTEGFGFAADGMLNENYAVSHRNLLVKCGRESPWCEEPETGEERLLDDRCEQLGEEGPRPVTGDCEKKVNMVVVAAPRKDMLENESQILDDYLKSGGNMLFLLDPGTPQSFRDFLARWGIVVGDGHIVDKQRSLGDKNEITVLSGGQYFTVLPEPFNTLGISELTARLDATYYPGVTSLEPAEEGVLFFPTSLVEEEAQVVEEEGNPTIFGTALAVTSGESWLIKDPTRSEPNEEDRKDFFFPAVAVKAIAPVGEELPSRLADLRTASIIIFGDSDFASNRYFYSSSNSDFFLNSVNWLVGDIALADIRPKPFASRELALTRNEFNFMRYSGWLLLPFLMALVGGFAWWRRR